MDEIPEGEWFCVRCETKRKNQPVVRKKINVKNSSFSLSLLTWSHQNTVCCPTQTGALKPTTHEGDFIHIVCAKWNPAIDHNKEPYEFDRVQLGAYVKKLECMNRVVDRVTNDPIRSVMFVDARKAFVSDALNPLAKGKYASSLVCEIVDIKNYIGISMLLARSTLG